MCNCASKKCKKKKPKIVASVTSSGRSFKVDYEDSESPEGFQIGDLMGSFRFDIVLRNVNENNEPTHTLDSLSLGTKSYNQPMLADTIYATALLERFGLEVQAGFYNNWNFIKNPQNLTHLAHQVEITAYYSHNNIDWSTGIKLVLPKVELPAYGALPICLWELLEL